tara:strand:- start:1959 stop:3230 length:1272 start_codon:yes stop_codon:yes gene_type:complete
MILLYRILTILVYPLLFIFLYYRKIIKKEDPIKFKEKILPSCFKVERKARSKLIWFHAASIGEFKSIIPIIKKLLFDKKNLEILVTTTTLSSGNLAKIEFKKYDNVCHRFFPFDLNFLIKKFLKLWKPNHIFLVDSEIWPNLILTAKKKKIPIAIINARLTAKTFNKWMMFPNTAKRVFNSFDLCLTSNNETKNYLKKLNAKNIHFNGNIKLINDVDESKIKNLNEKFLVLRRFWVAASIHQGEDLFCLKTHLRIRKRYKDIITIIIPRHIDKTKDINDLSKKLNLKTQLLNNGDKILENKEIIIVNSFGVLQNYFKYAKSVFIGKSMLKKLENEGGQNPIDAAKLKCNIYHGPYVYNFKEIYEMLKKINIAKKVKTYEDLSNNLVRDLKNPLKKDSKTSNYLNNLGQRTLENTMGKINNFIK